MLRRIVLVTVAAFAVFSVAYAVGQSDASDSSTDAGRQPSTSTTRPGGPGSSAASLTGLVVQPRDTTSALTVRLLNGGAEVRGQTTLDLCNGSFPSESLRTTRLQDVAFDRTGHIVLSTEAVAYRGANATAQAFKELADVAAKCPARPVKSPIGEPTVTTKFEPAPDADWPKTPSVDRLAYNFTSTDDSGNTTHTIAVYLRRDRFLVGLYFSHPDSPQPPIAGKTTIADIVDEFEGRLAHFRSPTDHA